MIDNLVLMPLDKTPDCLTLIKNRIPILSTLKKYEEDIFRYFEVPSYCLLEESICNQAVLLELFYEDSQP